MTRWWLFPPRTREIQLDEKWSFVAKKEKHCDPTDPDDRERGDHWDHVAFDAEHRLVLAVVPGERTEANTHALVREVHARTQGRADVLLTSDEYAPYATAILDVYGEDRPAPRRPGPGRPPKPERVLPLTLCYATVRKTRQKGRVVEVVRTLVYGIAFILGLLLERSTVSQTINTSFIERHNSTDRQRNARKQRKSYHFSKEARSHEALTYFTMYSYNFCWPVESLSQKDTQGRKHACTPAMAAGLTDHVWSLQEWLTYPAKVRPNPVR